MPTMICYAFIKPVDLQFLYNEALQSELPEELQKFSAPFEKAWEEIRNWTTTTGMGTVVSSFGTTLVLCLPMDKVPLLSEFLHKYEYTAKVSFAIGIGGTILEAYQAMCVSESCRGEKIVLFSDDLEGKDEEYLSKAEDLYKIDIPGLDLDKEEPQDQQNAPKEDKQQPPGISDESKSTKQKVVETLLLLKQHSQDISRLREINPKAFEAIKRVIDSMIAMAHSGGHA